MQITIGVRLVLVQFLFSFIAPTAKAINKDETKIFVVDTSLVFEIDKYSTGIKNEQNNLFIDITFDEEDNTDTEVFSVVETIDIIPDKNVAKGTLAFTTYNDFLWFNSKFKVTFSSFDSEFDNNIHISRILTKGCEVQMIDSLIFTFIPIRDSLSETEIVIQFLLKPNVFNGTSCWFFNRNKVAMQQQLLLSSEYNFNGYKPVYLKDDFNFSNTSSTLLTMAENEILNVGQNTIYFSDILFGGKYKAKNHLGKL